MTRKTGSGKPKKSNTASADAPRINAWSLMPKTREAKKVLHERALLLATKSGQQHAQDATPYVRFRLGTSEQYGIAYAHLEEITQLSDITPVPCTPPAIAGVANYRGELLTLLDLKQFFRTEQTEHGSETSVIVVQAGDARVGLIVDEVEGNDEYEPDSLAPPLSSGGVTNMDYVQGIHHGRVTILNIVALLDDATLCVDEAVK